MAVAAPAERRLRAGVMSALAEVERGRQRDLCDLEHWLAIPSVSADARRRHDVVRAARWWAGALRALGASVTAADAHGRPVVVADLPGSAAGCVLVYGHYDVQPAERGWTSPPFAPTLRGQRLVARGAADDKGQLMHVLAALRALTASGAPRPRVLVIAEGGEEVGSPGLQGVVDRLVERVRPSVVLVCDTEQAAPGIPSVTVSQRGCVRFSLTVDAGGPEVHAGRFGGAVVDPARGLGVLIARLETLVAGPTFRAGPPPRIPGLHVRSDGEVRRALGTRKVLTGGCLDDRVTECSAFSVTRLAAGSRSAAVPSRAEADIDVRLPPGVDARAVAEALRLCARADGGPGGRVGIKLSAVHSGRWFVPSPRLRAAVDRASLATFGAPVALVRSGGSLPAATILARATGSSPVLLGLAPSGSGAHGPDEFLDVASWHQGVGLLVRLLTDLADASESGVRRSRGVAPVCRHVALDGTSD